MKKLLSAAALLALTASSASFAVETLQDTDNHAHDKAYNVNQNTEFFVYLGGRGGIANYHGDASGIDAEALEQGELQTTTNSLSNESVGWGAGFVGLGYRYGRIGVRVEGEASFYAKNDVTDTYVKNLITDEVIKDKLKVETYMANFYADAYAQKNCVFYLMAGVGDAKLEYGNNDVNHLAWQVGLGGQYYFLDHLGGEIGLRYQDLGDVTSKSGITIEPSALQLYLGLIGRF